MGEKFQDALVEEIQLIIYESVQKYKDKPYDVKLAGKFKNEIRSRIHNFIDAQKGKFNEDETL